MFVWVYFSLIQFIFIIKLKGYFCSIDCRT